MINKILALIKKDKVLPYDITLPDFEDLHKNYDIVIHIGAPKTGSSAIQKFLLEHRIKLIEFGFYYPKHGLDENGISGGHSNLGPALSKNLITEAKTFMEKYFREAKDKNLTLLISAESLFDYPEKLKQITENHRCKIISFFRNPLDSVFSSYNQGVKRHFVTSSLDVFCKNILKGKVETYTDKIFDKWSENFGKDNLMVLGYDPVMLEKISIQELFLYSLGMDKTFVQALQPHKASFINKSYTPAALELKRMLNFVINKEDIRENNELDWFLQKLSDKQVEGVLIVDHNTQQLLQEKFEYSNLQVKNKYLLEMNPDFLNKSNLVKRVGLPYTEVLKGVIVILNNIKSEKTDLYDYIVKCTQEKLKINPLIFEVLNLAKWLDIPNTDINERDYWFTQRQINNMTDGKYKDVTMLRDIASLLLRRKDLANADKVISKALDLRPDGPGIIKIKNKVMELQRK